MIVIHDKVIESREQIEEIAEQMRADAYKEELLDFVELFRIYLLDCFEADEKLQEMVVENLSEDYICFSILPVSEIEDYRVFNFELGSKKDVKIKKREERLFENYCNICFGPVKTYYDRLLELAEK